MINGLNATILGIVEGLTEFLPISSTAHLILASEALGLESSEVLSTFKVSIQAGAILAVAFLYWRRFLDIEVMKRVAAAFLPTAAIGFILYKVIKGYLIGNIAVVLWALALGGLALILFERWYGKKMAVSPAAMDPIAATISPKDEIRSLSYGKSMIIGLAQAVAVIPGVSRSGATIIGGLWLGLSRPAIVEFSFLLAAPTILAAAGYDFLKSSGDILPSDLGSFVIGFGIAFVTAILAMKFFISYIQKHSFTVFGVYRIALAGIFFVALYLM